MPVGKQAGRDVNVWTLRFADSNLERQYRDSKLLFLFAATRTIYALAAGIWAVFTLLNEFAIHDPSASLLALRIVAILGNIAAFVVTLAMRPGRWVEVGISAMAAFNLFCLSLVLASMSPVSLPYYTPLSNAIVQVLCCYSFGVISFAEGTLFASFVLAGFFASVTVMWPEPPLKIFFSATWLCTAISLVGLGSYLLDRTQRIAWLRQLDLTEAEDRIRALLHNVLPPSIAARKLDGEAIIADDYGEASLLFADVVGFTALSATMSSTALVTMLNELFARFDRIVARRGLEKIKTIGDCYMVASGVPHARDDHLQVLMSVALEILDEVTKVRTPDGGTLAVRIGMHSGPVTAGVIGRVQIHLRCLGRYRQCGEPDGE
ncbi:adenylate/guanylate cyclase domain-containing protein [Bradyrhizobium sp. CER78]|uniref:adenylate/guanylate cyclase domain-containing protein n=1 Tax=Bradyrhizobium sp. CER78 TaxID=3039162 RepID=UPI00244CE1F3|nr:adenylate/guanylate cyclase domain-containing protein [Bradyrhizobium sp. CER78]MDH2385775.1 adenylate/guanylate cyclase domain-containing protein [Bradyrhizobium sp. CER78]